LARPSLWRPPVARRASCSSLLPFALLPFFPFPAPTNFLALTSPQTVASFLISASPDPLLSIKSVASFLKKSSRPSVFSFQLLAIHSSLFRIHIHNSPKAFLIPRTRLPSAQPSCRNIGTWSSNLRASNLAQQIGPSKAAGPPRGRREGDSCPELSPRRRPTSLLS